VIPWGVSKDIPTFKLNVGIWQGKAIAEIYADVPIGSSRY